METIQNEIAGFALQGIASERAKLSARLQHLDEQEKALKADGMFGLPRKARKAKAATAEASTGEPTRPRRQISPEQRQKMSEAAKARWSKRKTAGHPAEADEQASV